MKPKKFWTKEEANQAVEECQRNGWKAGVRGNRPYYVDAMHRQDDGTIAIYDLCKDGKMYEYKKNKVNVA